MDTKQQNLKNVLKLLLLNCLYLIILCNCSTAPSTETVLATIRINKIVDKITQRPIRSNFVTLRWETVDGEVIRTENYKDQSQLSTKVPADGSVRLFVTVKSQGYEIWSNAIRVKFNESKPIDLDVEMERLKGIQG